LKLATVTESQHPENRSQSHLRGIETIYENVYPYLALMPPNRTLEELKLPTMQSMLKTSLSQSHLRGIETSQQKLFCLACLSSQSHLRGIETSEIRACPLLSFDTPNRTLEELKLYIPGGWRR